jgi:hypothetical protein
MTVNSSFEADHPREPVGEFATKAQGAPEAEVALRPYVRTSSPIPELSLQVLSSPLSFYVDRREEIDMNPPYQRGSVWSETQQQDLIRSVLYGIPIGSITLNFRGYHVEQSYTVVDGKQRIEALRAFTDDEVEVPRDWFPDQALEGITHHRSTVVFSDLAVYGQRKFRNHAIPHIKSEVTTVAEEAEIFRLVNSGGTAQTAETLRQAALVEAASY